MRNIELKPMVYYGVEVVRFKDTGGMTTMSLDGTTTNGTFMVKVLDLATLRSVRRAQGKR
jgi:hypothetical protein